MDPLAAILDVHDRCPTQPDSVREVTLRDLLLSSDASQLAAEARIDRLHSP